jgi:hypothetical protein
VICMERSLVLAKKEFLLVPRRITNVAMVSR